jgi:hypothetical protein
MKITAILNTHGVPDITLDTVDSIRCHMTDRILVVVDGAAWDTFTGIDLPAYKLKGFNHNWYKSPYRNIFLGLLTAATHWSDSDWFCYIEYDCLVGSSLFKKDLEEAEKNGVWCVGNDYRDKQTVDLSLLERIVQGKFEEVVYLLGACIFYHKDFMKVALEKEFFQRFLFYTNNFQKGFFPFYDAWDLTEHAMPTIVKHFGGKIKQLATYNQMTGMWAGNYRRYPIRFRPELTYEEQHFLQASIMHPVKTLDHPIRKYHRAKRSNARITHETK